MQLYFMNEYLGNITDISVEGVWINGTFTPSESAKKFSDFFAYMVDEEKGFEEPPFSQNLLDENNWYVINKGGSRLGIDVPAVYTDGFITWRWR